MDLRSLDLAHANGGLYAVAAAVALAAIGLTLVKLYRPRRIREAETKERAAATKELQAAVKAGTHDERGYPLCQVCASDRKVRATHFGIQIRRSNGIWDWIKRLLGAPARFTPQPKLYDGHELCHVHYELEMSIAREEVLAEETRLRQLTRESELRLGYLEQIGLRDTSREQWHSYCVDQDKARPSRKSSVVQLPQRKAQ